MAAPLVFKLKVNFMLFLFDNLKSQKMIFEYFLWPVLARLRYFEICTVFISEAHEINGFDEPIPKN